MKSKQHFVCSSNLWVNPWIRWLRLQGLYNYMLFIQQIRKKVWFYSGLSVVHMHLAGLLEPTVPNEKASSTPDKPINLVSMRKHQCFSLLHLLSSCHWGPTFYQLHLLFLLLMFLKHAQVHPSRGCSAGLMNPCGIPSHATQQNVIGGLVCFAAPL